MVDGFKAMSASFVSVGKEGCYLSEIIPQGAEEITSSKNAVSLQLLGTSGKSTAIYNYHLNDSNRTYKNANGWYNSSNKVITKENDVFFPSGTGFWVKGNVTLSLMTSGEVLMDSVQNDLVDGFRLVSNPFPVAIKLTSIVPSGADEITSSKNAISLQLLGPTGKSTAIYNYHLNDANRTYKNANGWYNSSNKVITSENDVEIPAGGSMWVKGNATLKLTVVSPFEAE